MTHIIHGYNATERRNIPVAVDAAGQIQTVTGGTATATLAQVEGGTGGGPGYSEGDVLLLRQTGTDPPVWFNTATSSNIAAPTNVRPIGGVSASQSVTNLPTTVATNAGAVNPSTLRVTLSTEDRALLTDHEWVEWSVSVAHSGLTAGQKLREYITPFGTANEWRLLTGTAEAALPGADPTYENLNRLGGLPTPATSSPSLTPYQIDGTGTVLYGIVDADAATIDPIGPATAVAIGTGAGEAQIVPGNDSGQKVWYTEGGDRLIGIISNGTVTNFETGATATPDANSILPFEEHGDIVSAPVVPVAFGQAVIPTGVAQAAIGGTINVTIVALTNAHFLPDFATGRNVVISGPGGGFWGWYLITSGLTLITDTALTLQLIDGSTSPMGQAHNTAAIPNNAVITGRTLLPAPPAAVTHVELFFGYSWAMVSASISTQAGRLRLAGGIASSLGPYDLLNSQPISYGYQSRQVLSIADAAVAQFVCEASQALDQATITLKWRNGLDVGV